jgi:hypothetical protein
MLNTTAFLAGCLACLASGRPQVLRSELPAEPIEDPAGWAWGQHPNGVGYKATNDLLYATCLDTPDSPLCYNVATLAQCTKRNVEGFGIKKTCMCAQHIANTKCTSIGAFPD